MPCWCQRSKVMTRHLWADRKAAVSEITTGGKQVVHGSRRPHCCSCELWTEATVLTGSPKQDHSRLSVYVLCYLGQFLALEEKETGPRIQEPFSVQKQLVENPWYSISSGILPLDIILGIVGPLLMKQVVKGHFHQVVNCLWDFAPSRSSLCERGLNRLAKRLQNCIVGGWFLML